MTIDKDPDSSTLEASDEKTAGEKDPVSVTEKVRDFGDFEPLPVRFCMETSKEVTIRTNMKAQRVFETQENFFDELMKLNSEVWADLTISTNNEEFQVTCNTTIAQTVYDTFQRIRVRRYPNLRISCDVIQTAVLDIDIKLLPGTRRICLRVARFGERYRHYDAKTATLVDPPNLGKPIKVRPGTEEKHIRLELACSTRYAVKYCITNGEKYKEDVFNDSGKLIHKKGSVKWSKYCKKVQIRTPCEDQPPPPSLEAKPGGKIGINLPKLPPNAQHLTLWLKRTKEGEPAEDFKVFDYMTKNIVENEGRAIPIWDFGRYVEIKLEPDTEYTVKYSLMQNDKWRVKQSYDANVIAGPLVAYFAKIRPCYVSGMKK